METKSYQYFSKEHDMVRKSVREFIKKEVLPNIHEWEEAGTFPRELYKKSAEIGALGVCYPEELGGIEGDVFLKIVVGEELMRSTSGGLTASLGSHDISIPPIVRVGTNEQKKKFVEPVLAGDRISALGITEPGGGSDVANIKTTAVRDGDYYIVNGSKTFITSGIRADQLTTAVRTGENGAHGISLLIIESDSKGYSTSKPLKKTGWWASDTAEIFFDDCKVPVSNLIGEENKGFYYIMENFLSERLQLCIMANITAELALNEAVKYAKSREAFGKSLTGFQVIRHKLVDMATQVEVSKEFTYRIAAKIDSGENPIKEISMAKNFACDICDKVTYEAVQIFGGHGYMRENVVDRLWRDGRLLSIGGGTTEIMKEIISKFLAL